MGTFPKKIRDKDFSGKFEFLTFCSSRPLILCETPGKKNPLFFSNIGNKQTYMWVKIHRIIGKNS